MYCTECGAELAPESKFCTNCGAKIKTIEATASSVESDDAEIAASPSPTESVKAPQDATGESAAPGSEAGSIAVESSSNSAEQSEAPSNFKQAVGNTKKRSHRRVPLIVLVALAVALAAGAAYAAFYVYNEIIAPQSEAQQQTGQQSATEEEIPEASTSAENIFQVANLIAMGQDESVEDILATGLEPLPAEGDNPQTDLNEYMDMGTADLSSYLDETGAPSFIPRTDDSFYICLNSDFIYNLLREWYSLYSSDSDTFSSDYIFLRQTGVLTDDQFDELAEYCDLSETAATFKFSPDTEPVDENSLYGSMAAGSDMISRVGFVEVNGQDYIWYYLDGGYQDANNYETAYLGCCSLNTAYNLVDSVGLFLEDEWADADNAAKADMIAKSLVQTMEIGNGGMGPHVLKSGFRVYSGLDSKTGKSTWTDTESFDEGLSIVQSTDIYGG